MGYQTGTATSPTNLLQTLVSWLASNGWTTDSSIADGAGWRAHLHKGSVYANLRAAVNESVWAGGNFGANYSLNLYLGSGYSSGAAWNAQAGGPIGSGQTYTVGVGFNLPSGSIQNYYFFADSTGDNIAVVVEKTAAIYQHICWGTSLSKIGAPWTGGAYFCGSMCGYMVAYNGTVPGTVQTSSCPMCDADGAGFSNGYVRADIDAFTGQWLSVSTNTTAAQGYTGKRILSSVMPQQGYTPSNLTPRYTDNASQPSAWQANQTSSVDGRANLLPIHIYAVRDVGGVASCLGTVPFIFYTNGVGVGFSNASEYVLGPTTYKMFPNFAVVKQ